MRRLLAAACAALLALLPGTRGLCAMAPAPDGPDRQADAHACCRTGVLSSVPSCCVDAPAADQPAREPGAAAALAPFAAGPVLPPPSPFARPAAVTVAESPPGHSPPPPAAILRI